MANSQVFNDKALVTQGGAEGFELATTAAAAAAQHEIQSAIIVAKKFPRDESQSFDKLMKASDRTSFAEDAAYSFPRGGTQIEGPSVNLAREAARVWGNIRYGVDIVRDDEESRLIRAWAWDVETNTRVSAEDDFKKLIQRRGQGWIVPDERDLRELTNRRAAILVRNCILQILPKDLVEDAMERCKATRKTAAETDKTGAISKVVQAFSALKVTGEMLESYLGHPLSESVAEEIALLRTVYKSISDGNSTWAEYVKPAKKESETGSLNPADLTASDDVNRGHGNENLAGVINQESEREPGDDEAEGEKGTLDLGPQLEMVLARGPDAFIEEAIVPEISKQHPDLARDKRKLRPVWALLWKRYSIGAWSSMSQDQARDLYLYIQTPEFDAALQKAGIV